MKKLCLVIAMGFYYSVSLAQQQLNLVPYPNEVTVGIGNFQLNVDTKIICDKRTNKLATYLKEQIENLTGFSVTILQKNAKESAVISNSLYIQELSSGALGRNYLLEVNEKNVHLKAGEKELLFNGIQTFLQLIPIEKGKNSLSIPILFIKDSARFSYRGMHLDVSRHFFPVVFIKKYIDLLALHKFNTFHWHLTDDQGWRIEIKKYPLLTKVGGYRNGTIIGRYPGKGNDSIHYGGYYTQQQIKEIVQYASDRYITVIPEIEMPGHASAAIAAYPQLSCFPNEDTQIDSTTAWAGSRVGKQVQQTWGVFNDVFAPTDYTFSFIENVLDEVMALFPSTYIHIGGDECPKENWKRSPFCQQLIKSKNLKDEHGLQSYFIQRIEKYINSKGKKIIGWDEILEGGLAPNATVMSWRGTEGGIAAAKENHDVIMTPGSHCYFDHSQSSNEDSVTIGSFLPLEKVYAFDPVPPSLSADQAKHILGAQGNVWTEYITNESKVEYMVLPRMAALADVLWQAKDKKNFENFEKCLPFILKMYKASGYNYSTAYYDLKGAVIRMPNNQILWKLETKNQNGGIILKINGKIANKYLAPVIINETGDYEAATTDEQGLVNGKWIKQNFKINKASGHKITLKNDPNNSYSGNGAFTLVDGIQNNKGMAKSEEFLGFLGKDMEAVIDFEELTNFNKVYLHTFTRTPSWIYPAKQNSIKIFVSNDGINFSLPENEMLVSEGTSNLVNKITFGTSEKMLQARFIKIVAEPYGIIPSGNPGAGNPAWLFVDEIEVM